MGNFTEHNWGISVSAITPTEARIGHISPDYMNDLFYPDLESVLRRSTFNSLTCRRDGPVALRTPLHVDADRLREWLLLLHA